MIKKIFFSLFVLVVIAFIGVLLWLSSILYVFGNSVPESFGEQEIVAESILDWESQRSDLLQTFEQHTYGNIPTQHIKWDVRSRVLDPGAYNDRAVVEEVILTSKDDTELSVGIVLVTPKETTKETPLILATNFCANHNAWPQYEVKIPRSYPRFCDGTDAGLFGLVGGHVMGEFISTYPAEQFLDQGIALASFYPGEFVADNKTESNKDLERISKLTGTKATGAVAGWAWGFLEVMRVLEGDVRIDENAIVLYGHSRNGKASLLAAAVDESVDGVIVHQSGRGGASLSVSPYGETISQITERYDYWFEKGYKEWASREGLLPVDQHQLVALVAPRPIIVTGARLDKWGDPKGAFGAARSASVVYELYGHTFSAKKLTDFLPHEKLSFFMRPSFHGVRGSDWDAFIEFVEIHFGT